MLQILKTYHRIIVEENHISYIENIKIFFHFSYIAFFHKPGTCKKIADSNNASTRCITEIRYDFRHVSPNTYKNDLQRYLIFGSDKIKERVYILKDT